MTLLEHLPGRVITVATCALAVVSTDISNPHPRHGLRSKNRG